MMYRDIAVFIAAALLSAVLLFLAGTASAQTATPTVTLTPTKTPTPTATPSHTPAITSCCQMGLFGHPLCFAPQVGTMACCGDCDHGGTVTSDEATTAVLIKNGAALAGCPSADCGGNGAVDDADLAVIFNNLLVGCPAPGQLQCGAASVVDDTVCAVGIGGGSICVTPSATPTRTTPPTQTRTRTPSRTPTPQGPPGPPIWCAGPAPCTANGEPTDYLRLCKPAAGDANWHVGFNGNSDLLDSLFPGCALQPVQGGTGVAELPNTGDLLVGGTDGKYHRLAPGQDGDVLIADQTRALGMAWAPPCSRPCPGGPLAQDCDLDEKRGRCCVDGTQLYVCNGATRGWDYVQLQP